MRFLEASFLIAVLVVSVMACAAEEKVVEISSRGHLVRALELIPEKPVAAVILLAGGDGDLGLTRDGKIRTNLDNNQLVRSRQDYAKAGFAVLVPDRAADLKNNDRWRETAANVEDLGAMVRHLRDIAQPVVIIGTSRGTLSAAMAVANLSGERRPDAMVLTSAFLSGNIPSVQRIADRRPERLAVPTLVIGHRDDECRFTLPSYMETFRKWMAEAGQKVDVLTLSGGQRDPRVTNAKQSFLCSAAAPHGFPGLDDAVVSAVSDWIRGLGKYFRQEGSASHRYRVRSAHPS